MKRAAAGGAAIAAYVVASVLLAHTNVVFRPVFDGFAPPQPYQYVNPPPDLRSSNKPPRPLNEVVPLQRSAGQSLTFTTADGQVQVIAEADAIARRAADPEVRLRITPLDPSHLPQPSGALVVQGNAYRIEATYSPSGDRVMLTKVATVILRYPATATGLARLSGRTWKPLRAQLLKPSLQVFAETQQLGTFAAVGLPHATRWWIPLVAAAAGLLAAFVGWRTGRRRTRTPRRRPRTPRRRRPS